MRVLFKTLINFAIKLSVWGLLVFGTSVYAQEIKPFQPFDLSSNKSMVTTLSGINNQSDFFQNALANDFDNDGYDFLTPQSKGYHLSKNKQGLFGDELVVGMKFADWLSLRINVIEDNDSFDLFSSLNQINAKPTDSDFVGYQLGVSSVMNISDNWRLGFDLGRGQVGGELLGLYQDQIQTTSFGLGVRNQRIGATFQTDFMNSTTYQDLEQSTMDLQVDWHFTQDGTLSFGARRSVNENNASTNEEQLTGTVPYIKFKHSL